jgi:nicotinamide mononucleotide transporter
MNWYNLFIKPYEAVSAEQIILEAAGTILGILSVYFSIKKNIWVYPSGIASTMIYVYLLFVAGLYGDFLINIYYTVMSVYGWVLWRKNSKDNVHVEVSWTTKKEWVTALLLFIASAIFILIIYYYKPAIDNYFSGKDMKAGFSHLDFANWLDVITTAIFLVGMWLMAKRRIENWLFWIIGDFISIPMYIYKGLGITSVQYLVFTTLAVIGYMTWRNSLQTNTKEPHEKYN